ncbi:hypothetical protein VJY32_08120 [Ignavibacteria bacterium 4148-Me]|uniref:hypothetical protein n=1 Tax=Rosettibacter primus TaxID=3111523 RepID=UPI00336BDF20
MPKIYYEKQIFPDWCELRQYHIFILKNDDELFLKKYIYQKSLLFLCEGEITFKISEENEKRIKKGDIIDMNEVGFLRNVSNQTSIIIVATGNWTEITNSGIFTLDNTEFPRNIGDYTSYSRNTNFDNHFHDCDEYWIFYEGEGIAVSEGNFYKLQEGVCIATKAGFHHDIPIIHQRLKGIYFETSLKGKKRTGHLWNHTHAYGEA